MAKVATVMMDMHRFFARPRNALQAYKIASRLFLFSLCIVVPVKIGFYLYEEVHVQKSHVLDVVESLGQHTNYIFADVEAALIGIVRNYELGTGREKSPREIDERLARQSDVFSSIDEIIVVGDDGKMKYVSDLAFEHERSDFSNRVDFLYLKNKPDSGTYISGPAVGMFGASRNQTVLRISRAIKTPGNDFAGMITATISVQRFVDAFRKLKVASGGIIEILNRNGSPLFQYSIDEKQRVQGRYAAHSASVLFTADDRRAQKSSTFDDFSHMLLGAYFFVPTGQLSLVLSTPYWSVYNHYLSTIMGDVLVALIVAAIVLSLARYSLQTYIRSEALIARQSRRLRHLAMFSTEIQKSDNIPAALEALGANCVELLNCQKLRIEVSSVDGNLAHEAVGRSELHNQTAFEMGGKVTWGDGVAKFSSGLRPSGKRKRADRQVQVEDFHMHLSGAQLVRHIDFTIFGLPVGDKIGRVIARQFGDLCFVVIENLLLEGKNIEALEIAAEARQDAEQKERNTREILNSISDNFFSLDENWRFTHVNHQASESFGAPESELIGKSFWELVPHARETVVFAEFHKARETGKMREFEVYSAVRHKWFQNRIFPFERGISVYFRDITRRVEMQEELLQAQKLKAVGSLTGGVAHDFNNLLTVILNNIDELAIRFADDAEARVNIDLCEMAAERATELTRQLLAFSRKQPLTPQSVDLDILLRNVQRLLERTLGENIQLVCNVPYGLCRAYVDPAQLETALINLAINARDAMPDGGKIAITAANSHGHNDGTGKEKDMIAIHVKDSGTGIPPEILKNVFEPFFTTKEVGKGSGLGLSMVHGFVYQSGGKLELHSEPGKGTEIILYLPRFENQAPVVAHVINHDKLKGGPESLAVIVENAPFRLQLVARLRELGYDVREFDGERDFMKAQSEGDEFDGIIAEGVPREDEEHSLFLDQLFLLDAEMPAVLLTQIELPVVREQAKNATSLLMPVNPDAIARAIRKVLDNAKPARSNWL
ncbi:hypothetical protein COO20_06200 [Thalassospira marina]|uniref:histidine kinase n=2 Tax=Thalassospira marina TaxID=2048283 RepID=A0A2N3KWU8_9PROT|nr:hypothetical protein COO20_06200 [Thalassospira marina]